jgi:virulence-associated protein VagC
MRRTAKIFMNNRSPAVQLSQVFIRKQGEGSILSARHRTGPSTSPLVHLPRKAL